MRMRVAFLCGACLVGPATAAAGPKKAEAPPAPAEVVIENACAAALDLQLGEIPIKVEPNGRSGPHLLPPAGEGVYELNLAGAKPAALARPGIPPGSKYAIRVADCRAGSADVYTRIDGLAPPSPHAAARVRFRARQNLTLEYKMGAAAAFRPLSIALTSPAESKAGEAEVTFRLRAARNGPILKTFRKTVNLDAGHRYLVEANLVEGDLLFSVEDEGLDTGT